MGDLTEPLYLLYLKPLGMHKKIALSLFVLLCTGAVSHAQFKKGTRMAGATIGTALLNTGSAEISYPNITGYTNKATSWSFNFNPNLGWFISENTAVGFSMTLNPSGTKNTFTEAGSTFQSDKTSQFSTGIGGFVRNYFKSKSAGFLPFGQFSLNLGMNSSSKSGFFYGGSGSSAYKSTYDGKSSGDFYSNASFTLGMTKLVTPHTGLDFYAGYTFSYNKSTTKTTTKRDDGNNGTIDQTSESNPTSKFTNHGFQLGVGFQIFLDPKK